MADKRNAGSQKCARMRTLKKRGSVCEWCGYKGSVELHHIVDMANGGTHNDENLLLLCYPCHHKAHGKKLKRKGKEYWELVQRLDGGM
jgi:5-methylcytosine-specific restriction endonuclease McrA